MKIDKKIIKNIEKTPKIIEKLIIYILKLF